MIQTRRAPSFSVDGFRESLFDNGSRRTHQGLPKFGLSLIARAWLQACLVFDKLTRKGAAIMANDAISIVPLTTLEAANTVLLQSSTPEPKPIPTATASPAKQDMAIVGALIGIIIVLACLFLYLVVPPLLARLRRLAPVSKKRIESRYETIEGWLITKRVRAHDDKCECSSDNVVIEEAIGQHSAPLEVASSTAIDKPACATAADCEAMEEGQPDLLQPVESHDTEDTVDSDGIKEENECSICMSSFQVDEIVSWSPNEQCNHVYHHECIKEWLLRHSNCPFCRHVYLPINEGTQHKLERSRYKELCLQRSRRVHRTYFCAEAGLVCLQDTLATCDADNNATETGKYIHLTRRVLVSQSVRKGVLAELRGGRREDSYAGQSQCYSEVENGGARASDLEADNSEAHGRPVAVANSSDDEELPFGP